MSTHITICRKCRSFICTRFIATTQWSMQIKVKGSIYFATLQGYLIFETKLYIEMSSFGKGGGGGCQKAQKPINWLSSIICNIPKYGNILYLYVLHISNAYKYTVQNMFLNFRWFMFGLRYASVDFKPYVTL